MSQRTLLAGVAVILHCLGLVALAGCGTPRSVRAIAAAHPDATYATTVKGCDRLTRKGKQFGGDLWRAVRWSREVVAISRILPCESVVEAVGGGVSTVVYRVARTLDGRRHEGGVGTAPGIRVAGGR